VCMRLLSKIFKNINVSKHITGPSLRKKNDYLTTFPAISLSPLRKK